MNIQKLLFPKTSTCSPLKILAIIVCTIFLSEMGVMVLLQHIDSPFSFEMFFDAILLILLLFPILFFAIYKPMTQHLNEQQRIERDIANLVAFFKSILDNMISGVLVTDVHDKIFFANRRMEKIAGTPVPKIEGMHILTDFPKETVRVFKPYYLKAQKTRQPVYYETLPVTSPSGRHSFQSGWLIPRIKAERYDGMICTVEDVTQHKTAKAALQASEQRYKDLFENANDAIFIVDPDLNYLDVNKKAVELFGYSKEEFLRMKVPDVVPPQQFFQSDPESARFHSEEKYGRSIGKQRTRDGRWLDIEVSSSTIVENGKIVGFRDIVRDITDRKRLEDQLRQAQKMEAIGTLAGGIAHDFNNILYAIKGYTQLSLPETAKDSPLYENLKEIDKSVKRAAELVKQILTFSRKADEKKHPLRLEPVVKEALKLLRGTLPSTIEIRRDIDPHGKPILADLTQIHQVILNLCSNAAHAMEENGGVLTVALEEVEVDRTAASQVEDLREGLYALLTVADTGHGMDTALLGRIFDPYFTTKGQGKGTGLGLATVHGIVKNHHGAIHVTSEPTKGTKFEIYFPVLEQNVSISQAGGHEPALMPVSGHILVVDDEEPIVRIVQRGLKRLGCEVTAFTSSTKALMAFQNDPFLFDAVLTDQTMPSFTGLELTKKFLEIRPEIPVILTTGYSAAVDEEQAKACGVKAFLMKPLSIEEMSQVLHTVLHQTNSKTEPDPEKIP